MTSIEEKQASELPNEECLKQAAVTAQQALDAHSTAKSLKETASSIKDPTKREKILKDAYTKEVEAHGMSKKARMLQSGAFQGATGGAGIGGAIGLGVGTVVGTIVGTVTAIPTAGLGALAGAGVGVIHGPFIKLPNLGGGKNDLKNDKEELKKVRKGDELVEKDNYNVVPDPVALQQVADTIIEERAKQSSQGGQLRAKEKKKPRKIEIRSGKKP